MPLFESYRRKCEELLRQASETTDLKERSRLLDQALQWHRKAAEVQGLAPQPRQED